MLWVLTLIVVILPLELLGIIILFPILLVYRNSESLPGPLRWFDNYDIHSKERDRSVYEGIVRTGQQSLGGLIYRYYWLALRNPLNYFGYTVLGFKCRMLPWESIKSDLNIGDASGQSPGFLYLEYEQDNKIYFEYYYIKKWSDTKCLRVRIGHKLKNTRNDDFVQWVFVISPYHSYSGG